MGLEPREHIHGEAEAKSIPGRWVLPPLLGDVPHIPQSSGSLDIILSCLVPVSDEQARKYDLTVARHHAKTEKTLIFSSLLYLV